MRIIETIDECRAHIVEVTSKARPKEKKLAKAKAVHPLVADLQGIMDTAVFGCHTASVAKILNALAGQIIGDTVHLVVKKEGNSEVVYNYPRFSAVVALVEDDSHNYGTKHPFIVKFTDADGQAYRAIRRGGTHGNTHFGAWRYATDEEIAAMPDEQIKAAFNL